MSTAGVITAEQCNLVFKETDLMIQFEKLLISTQPCQDAGAPNSNVILLDQNPVHLVNHPSQKQSLAQLMRKHHDKEVTLTNEQCNLLALLCAQEIQALHEKGIVHGKINPWNFLVQLDGQKVKIKLSEKDLSPTDAMKDYKAPELKMGQPTMASDIYAYGCMMNAFKLLNMGQRFDYLCKQMCNSKAAKHPELRKPLQDTISFLKDDGFGKLSQSLRIRQ